MTCMNGGNWYNLWRTNCGPTRYPSNKTPVTADVTEAGLYYAGGILFLSVLVIVLGFRGRQKAYVLIKAFIAIFVLTSIMLCNYGQEWETSRLDVVTPYRAGLDEEVHAELGVKIGLRSVNITLRGSPEVAVFKNGTHEERINYNERLSWNNLGWDLGRAGFGKYAGLFNREYREHQQTGTPYPILWVAEYFTIDGEGIRWGRHYLQAGYYTHILIWTALPLWVITCCLTVMVLLYSGIMSILTGLFLLGGNIIFATLRNRNELSGAIPFAVDEDGETEHMMFSWGWCFWLNMVTGLICTVLGIVIIIMEMCFHDQLATFFGIHILQEYEEYYADPAELGIQIHSGPSRPRSRSPAAAMEMTSMAGGGNDDSDYEDVNDQLRKPQFRRRTNTLATTIRHKVGKSQKHRSRPEQNNVRNTRNYRKNPQSPPHKTRGSNGNATDDHPKHPHHHTNGAFESDPDRNGAASKEEPTTGKAPPKAAIRRPKDRADKTAETPTVDKAPPASASANPELPAAAKKQPPKTAKKQPASKAAAVRDHSGRDNKSAENVFSGEYDNNYENVEVVKGGPVSTKDVSVNM